MTEQYVPNLGQTPAEDARRDAVHIAVAPVIADMPLDPGDHVFIDEDGRAYKGTGLRGPGTVGVVDPFFGDIVRADSCFWLFLYPGTVTGMRHQWTHPAFAPKMEADK
jgi:hypothetical protein